VSRPTMEELRARVGAQNDRSHWNRRERAVLLEAATVLEGLGPDFRDTVASQREMVAVIRRAASSRADTERLDWLDEHGLQAWVRPLGKEISLDRAAIDAARAAVDLRETERAGATIYP